MNLICIVKYSENKCFEVQSALLDVKIVTVPASEAFTFLPCISRHLESMPGI